MNPPDWLTLVITAVPLFGIAGSSVAYVVKLYQDAAERRRSQFFKLLELIDGTGPIAGKLGAVHGLREFKEHSAFIERFCRTQRAQISGDNAQSLIAELDATASSFTSQRQFLNAQNR